MGIIIRLGILTAVLVTGCQSTSDRGFTMDEYTVYLAVVRPGPAYPIVINSTIDTFGEVSSGKLPELIPGIRSDTIANWVNRNKEPVRLSKDLSFQHGYEVVAHSEVEESARFYSASRVGFSEDGQQAFLRLSFICEPLCSEGAFYLLENKQGVWEIVSKSESWKS